MSRQSPMRPSALWQLVLVLVLLCSPTDGIRLDLLRRLLDRTDAPPTVHISLDPSAESPRTPNSLLELSSQTLRNGEMEGADASAGVGGKSLAQTLQLLEQLQEVQFKREQARMQQEARDRESQTPPSAATQAASVSSNTDDAVEVPQVVLGKAVINFQFESDAIKVQGLDRTTVKPICCWARWAQSQEPHNGIEDFNGNNAYLALNPPVVGSDTVVIGGGPMSFEIVVRVRDFDTTDLFANLFDYGSGVQCQDNILLHVTGGGIPGTGSLDFRVYQNSGLGGLGSLNPCDESNVKTMTVDRVLRVQTWHYIVVTIDSKGLWRVYVDGKAPVGFQPFPGFVPAAVARSKVLLGRSSWVTNVDGSHLNGEIDAFRYWSQALTPAEVQQLYDEQQPLNCELDEWPNPDDVLKDTSVGCYFFPSLSDFGAVPNTSVSCLPSFWKNDQPRPPPEDPPEPLADFLPTPAYKVVQRKVRRPAARGGTPCPSIKELSIKVDCLLKPCPLACLLGKYSDWSQCDKTCGPEGIDVVGEQARTRYILTKDEWNIPPGSPTPCETASETNPCPIRCPVNCQVSSWGVWSTCSVDCGRGTQSRTRDIIRENNVIGSPCPSQKESKDCNTQACVRHCKMSEFFPSTWGPGSCTVPCGNGTITQTRSILQLPVAGGNACPPSSRIIPCNTDPCPAHCVVENWGNWGPCNKDCGDGVRTRTRTVKKPAEGGGLPCPALLQAATCPDIKPCDYLAKLRNLKDRIRRLELQRRVEYLEHLHLLAKARQILFPPTLPMSSSADAPTCPPGGCGSSSSAPLPPSSSAVYIPPPAPKPIIVKEPIVYVIDRPYPVAAPQSSSAPLPPVYSSSAAAVPCSDGGCVEADVVECCPGHCCAPPPPPRDLVEADAVDHLDTCCDHASPMITCCVLPPLQTCCHWPSPHSSCCTALVVSVPPPDCCNSEAPHPSCCASAPEPEPARPQSCCHLEHPNPKCCSGRPFDLADDEGDEGNGHSNGVHPVISSRNDEDNTCCAAVEPHPHCCASFKQKHKYTDTEQLEVVDNNFLQLNSQSRSAAH